MKRYYIAEQKEKKWFGNLLEEDPELRQRIITTLTYMIGVAVWREDEVRQNMEVGSAGGYSDELQEAKDLLAEIEKGG